MNLWDRTYFLRGAVWDFLTDVLALILMLAFFLILFGWIPLATYVVWHFARKNW